MTQPLVHSNNAPHQPVLLREVLTALDVRDGATYVDGTFGAGGYSSAILDAAKCNLIGIDRDPNVVTCADEMTKSYDGRFRFLSGCFGEMSALLPDNGVPQVDGIVLDIGVSSMQIDNADRGFSFMRDGPLDMRMSQSGQSAADVVNSMEETQLADVIYTFGEERASRRVAKAIVMARANKKIETTLELAEIVRGAIRVKGKQLKHPATKTFQALRMYVNGELDELQAALESAESLLVEGGRLVVVTFHSLEDRMVKTFMKQRTGRVAGQSRHVPKMAEQGEVSFEIIRPFPAKPQKDEVEQNTRARSARLRAMQKIQGDAS